MFSSSAEESLGTYSYRTSSRNALIPFRWLTWKIFFFFCFLLGFRRSCLASTTERFSWRVSEKWVLEKNSLRSIFTVDLLKLYRNFIVNIDDFYVRCCFWWRAKMAEYTSFFVISPRSLNASEAFHDVQIHIAWATQLCRSSVGTIAQLSWTHLTFARSQKSLTNIVLGVNSRKP